MGGTVQCRTFQCPLGTDCKDSNNGSYNCVKISKRVMGEGGEGVLMTGGMRGRARRSLAPGPQRLGESLWTFGSAETLLIAAFSMVSLAHLVGRSILTFFKDLTHTPCSVNILKINNNRKKILKLCGPFLRFLRPHPIIPISLHPIALQCPAHSRYTNCLPPCPPSCTDLDGHCEGTSPKVPSICKEGCVCQPGYVLNNNTCVLQMHCDCRDARGDLIPVSRCGEDCEC